jgi:hypothetical protein
MNKVEKADWVDRLFLYDAKVNIMIAQTQKKVLKTKQELEVLRKDIN